MDRKIGRSAPLGGAVVVAFAAAQLAAAQPAEAAAKCIKGDREAPYTIGWANIYSIPTWMKQTQGTIEDVFAKLKDQGLTDQLVITDAEGNANTQITQIQSMIDADVDGIVVIAGSATALDRVIEQACEKGIAVVNVDSLVTTDQLTAKINTDSQAWGRLGAEWLVEQLGGEGKIIVMNGPAGVSVSEDRRAGATPVLEANPGIEVLTETNTPYNAAPAQEAMSSLLFQYPEIDGILSYGGALTAGAILAMDRQGRDIPPNTGENYRQYLELWKEKDLDGLGHDAAQLAGRARCLCLGDGARGQGRAGIRRGAAADHHQRQPRRLPRPRRPVPGRRLHLFRVQPGDVRPAALQVVVARRRTSIDSAAA